MRRLALLPLFALSLGLVGCDELDSPTPPPPYANDRTVDLGDGRYALYTDSGHLTIVDNGKIKLYSPVDGALFAIEKDHDAPDAFHDPTKLDDVSWTTIAPGEIALDSPAPGELHLVLPDQGDDTTRVTFTLASDESFVTGSGEQFGHVGLGGENIPLFLTIAGSEGGTNEAHVPIPFFVSTSGYGVFVETREAGAFDFGAADAGVNRATFEGRKLDVTIFLDPDPLAVVAAYTRKTGLPRMPPEWAFSPMIWRNEWPDAATLESDMNQIRTRHIPTSCLWIDNPWQTSYNTAKLDPARFGDTHALMSSIAAEGFRTIAWSTPYLEQPKGKPADEAQELYVTAKAKSYFVKDQKGDVFGPLGCCYKNGLGMIDFTYPAASTFWEGILTNATDAGFAGFKLDYGEDLVTTIFGARLGTLRHDGETERTGRTYPLGYHAAYHAALDAARPDGFLIGRASSYGGQTVLDAVWPGDLDNDFSLHDPNGKVGGLPAAIIAAETLAASGFPNFGSDTGGYKNGAPTREALLRWAEHTAFTMVMQNGGGGDDHNPWDYDEQAASIYKTLATQHNQLVPYLEGLAQQASTDGTPTIRALPLAYPGDKDARGFADTEYMLGPDILVAPVVEDGAISRVVHFPKGDWKNWFTNDVESGPGDVMLGAPIGSPLVFMRAGAVIPMLPANIDTVVESTDPNVVSLKSHEAHVEARAFVSGHGSATFPNGSTITIDDGDDGVVVDWSPRAPHEDLALTLDLRRSRVGGAITTRALHGASRAVFKR